VGPGAVLDVVLSDQNCECIVHLGKNKLLYQLEQEYHKVEPEKENTKILFRHWNQQPDFVQNTQRSSVP